MKMRKTLMGIGAAAVTLVVSAEKVEEMQSVNWKDLSLEITKTPENRTMVFGTAVGQFRELASARPAAAVEYYFGRTASTKWKLRFSHEFSAQQITDFFTGAVALTGPQNAKRGVWGLYNPWWDAMIFLDLRVNDDGGEKRAPISVESFAWLSGETVRGEAKESQDADIRCATVVPGPDPISVEVWRSTSASKRAFSACLPLEGKVDFSPVQKMELQSDSALELKRMQIRSALRLKGASVLLKEDAERLKARELRRLLVVGSPHAIDEAFRDADSDVLKDTFKEMPGLFRKNFSTYGYLRTNQGRQFLFVNSKVPRLYATITIPEGTTKPAMALEWFDLAQSEQLLEAWNSRCAGVK